VWPWTGPLPRMNRRRDREVHAAWPCRRRRNVFEGVPYAALPFHRSLACPGRLPANLKVRLVGAAAASYQPEHVAEKGPMRFLIAVTLILSSVSCSPLRRQGISPAPVRGRRVDRRPN
jgi:hypothetical protein